MNPRKTKVDMSSQAIDARMREVAQLRQLGLSIAKAKPISAPDMPSVQSNESVETTAIPPDKRPPSVEIVTAAPNVAQR